MAVESWDVPLEVEAVLPPPCEGPPPRGQRERARVLENGIRLDALAGQVEATWASLGVDARALLKPRIERVAASFASKFASTGPGREGAGRLLRMIADGEPVPYELIIAGSDDVGWRLRAVVAASPEPDEARRELVALLADFHGTGKPGVRWREEAGSVREKMHEPAVLIGDLLDAALRAPDYVRQLPWLHDLRDGRQRGRPLRGGRASRPAARRASARRHGHQCPHRRRASAAPAPPCHQGLRGDPE